jgi:hypothetical protein
VIKISKYYYLCISLRGGNNNEEVW